jgi:hypothetical protein
MATLGRRRLLSEVLIAVLLSAVGALAWLHWWGARGTYLVAFQLIALVGISIRPSELEGAVDERHDDLTRIVGRALEGRGYQVLANPRTGRAEVDPLLAPVDLFAFADGRGLLVDIERPVGSSATVSWQAATAVVTAARGFPSQDLPPGVRRVHPVLVLVGGKPDEALRAFAADQSLSVWQLPGDDPGGPASPLSSEIQRTEEQPDG